MGRRQNNRQRGSILAVTLFLCVLASAAAGYLVLSLIDHQKTDIRRREMASSYFAAQAGIAQVMHWGNIPEDYDGGGVDGLFYRDLDAEDNEPEFPNLARQLAGGEIVIPSGMLREFKSHYDYDGVVSYNSELRIVPPDAANDPAGTLFSVVSEGRTHRGAHRRIVSYMQPNPILSDDLALPAALISLADAAHGGNAKVHWGEAWSKSDFDMFSSSQAGTVDITSVKYDEWVKYRTEGNLLFDPTWKSGEGDDIFEEDIRQFPGAAPASGDYALAMEQLIPEGELQWPDLRGQYQTFKDMAKAHGRYYSTDAAGNVYRDGIEDAAHLVDFTEEFEKPNRDAEPYDLVFIDTINQQPPADDGSNLAFVECSGDTGGLKGVFWIGANLVQTGTGNPPGLVGAEKPDGTTQDLAKVMLDGVLYASGTINFGGNPVIYGCVVTDGGFNGAGTPDVYYNHRLEDGLELPHGNIGSVFRSLMQDNYGD
ncbi:hypothetical protein ACFL34_05120 [Candidatus Sumerlaeota bacterium]